MRRRSAALIGLALLVAGCTGPAAYWTEPLRDLHACSAEPVVGVLTVLAPPPTRFGTEIWGADVYALLIDGSLRRLTDDDRHVAGAVAPDGRSAYLLRSSGEVGAGSLENPDVVERVDLGTGRATVVAHADEIIDTSVSADGRRLAVVSGAAESVITVVDLGSSAVQSVHAPREVPAGRFQGINAVAISPDAGRVAYVLAVQSQAEGTVDTLRLRQPDTGEDVLAYRALDGESITDVEWAPDGSRVLAAVDHRDRHSGVETPARYRVVRIDPRSMDVSVGDGFGPGITPLSSDGRELAGIVPRPNEAETRRYDLVTSSGATSVLALPQSAVARDLSLARCAYE